MKTFLKILFSVCIFSAFAHAEYRMFLLQIKKKDGSQYRFIESTLDPIQYADVYPIAPDEEIGYVDTWKCLGNTASYKRHCQKPSQPKTSSIQP